MRKDTVSLVAEAVGLGWALGLVLFTMLRFVEYLSGRYNDALLAPTALLSLLLSAVCVRAVWRDRVRAARHDGSSGAIVLVGGSVALACAAPAALLALRAPLSGFDAWSVWAFKARLFAFGGPLPGYFHDPLTLHTHPDYPLNLPLAEAALVRLGAAGPSLAALLGPACLLALLLLFFASLSRLYHQAVAALVTAALAAVPALSAQAGSGNADVPLALYLGGTALYLRLWWRERRPIDLLPAGLLAGGAVWTKKEGLAIGGLLMVAALFGEAVRSDESLRRRAGYAIRLILGAALVAGPWLLFLHRVHPLGRDFLPLTPSTLLAHGDRLPQIALFFALQMLAFKNWSLLWVVCLVALPLAARHLTPSGRVLVVLLAGQVGIYMLSFVFSSWQPYTAHIQTSLDRLLLQAVPLALLVLIESAMSMARARRPAAGLLSGEQAAR